ncbi:MAG: type 4b pilus protein PilO2 [Proteobacteria bacterium]|nr:type 4b pilus protein PilO2 [Candidatus Enterousia scatequi]
MVVQIIHINKKKYAVGLFWQPIASGFSGRNYARNLAHSIDKKLNLYTEARAMVGMGSYSYGQYSGMPVAAAEVMNGLSEYSSFLSAFAVDSGFYLVAVRNGVILVDRFFNDEQSARIEYEKLSELPDWAAFIAPESWDMPRAVERNINKIVSQNPRIVLHAVSRLRSIMWPLLVLLVFLFFVLLFFREPLTQMNQVRVTNIDPELAAEYKRQIEEKNKELDQQYDIQKIEIKPLVLPYDNLPDPIARAQQCFQAMGFLMQPIIGWNQYNVECNEQYVVAQIKRDYGTLGDFYMLASEIMPHAFVSEQNENTLMVSAKLPDIPVYSSQDERDADSVIRDITTIFQMAGISADTDTVVDTITNGVDTVQLNVVEIAAQSKLVPMQFMQIFQDFGGVYMTKCVWNAVNRTWNYEVIIYAK